MTTLEEIKAKLDKTKENGDFYTLLTEEEIKMIDDDYVWGDKKVIKEAPTGVITGEMAVYHMNQRLKDYENKQ